MQQEPRCNMVAQIECERCRLQEVLRFFPLRGDLAGEIKFPTAVCGLQARKKQKRLLSAFL